MKENFNNSVITLGNPQTESLSRLYDELTQITTSILEEQQNGLKEYKDSINNFDNQSTYSQSQESNTQNSQNDNDGNKNSNSNFQEQNANENKPNALCEDVPELRNQNANTLIQNSPNTQHQSIHFENKKVNILPENSHNIQNGKKLFLCKKVFHKEEIVLSPPLNLSKEINYVELTNIEKENINNAQPKKPRDRKHDNDSLIKKLLKRKLKYFSKFYNGTYGNSGLFKIERKNVPFVSIKNFKEFIQDKKMGELFDIEEKNNDVNSLLELKFDEVCQYISSFNVNPKAFEDDKFQYLKGFEKYYNHIFAKMDSEEINKCRYLMCNHFPKKVIIFQVTKY